MKRLVICGVTGSIGQNALKVMEGWELTGFSYFHNQELAHKIHQQYPSAQMYSAMDPQHSSVDSYQTLFKKTKPHLVLNAITGVAGLEVSRQILESGYDLALANKESMVLAGPWLLKIAKQNHCHIYPVDSEHSSLYDLLIKLKPQDVKNIYITASGGRYYHDKAESIANLPYEEVVNHPIWNMGSKISIDSATLINKCFELIEAYYFFKTKNIYALYHPQAQVHALVETKNHAVYTYLSDPDMRLPIDLALHKFIIKEPKIKPVDFSHLELSLSLINPDQHLPIKWAYELIQTNNPTIGIVVCLLDNYLIKLFMNHQIKFGQIISIIDYYLKIYKNHKIRNWNSLNKFSDQLLKRCETDLINGVFKHAKWN